MTHAFPNRFLRALAFLTRVPPRASAFANGPHPLSADVVAFPLVGLVAALPAALLAFALPHFGLSALSTAVFAIAALVMTTGALHEDGLGDVADGLFGHLPPERAVEVMKDSRIGTYGAAALVLSLTARIALLAELIAASPATGALALIGVSALSRGLMALLWFSLPPADPGGLADRMGRPARRDAIASVMSGFVLFAVFAAAATGLLPTVIAAALAFLAFAAFRSWLLRRLGGQTGDTLGAIQQLGEIALLLGLCLG